MKQITMKQLKKQLNESDSEPMSEFLNQITILYDIIKEMRDLASDYEMSHGSDEGLNEFADRIEAAVKRLHLDYSYSK